MNKGKPLMQVLPLEIRGPKSVDFQSSTRIRETETVATTVRNPRNHHPGESAIVLLQNSQLWNRFDDNLDGDSYLPINTAGDRIGTRRPVNIQVCCADLSFFGYDCAIGFFSSIFHKPSEVLCKVYSNH